VSGPSPFAAGCEGAPQTGTVYRNAEVEPWVDVNLADANNLVGNWQQDRWSNGGASGNLSAYSLNGGTTWTIPPISPASDMGQAKFSRCTGGNAANGGDFERATDPWVSFSPNGVSHQVALAINDSNVANAVLTSRSMDKGANWEDPVVVKFDDRANFFNDKETLTADPTDSRFVYVTWQRIVAPNERASARAGQRAAAFRSLAWFARSDDNGASYDLVKPILDPGNKAQTIGNQIVVLPNGDLVMVFNLIRNVGAEAQSDDAGNCEPLYDFCFLDGQSARCAPTCWRACVLCIGAWRSASRGDAESRSAALEGTQKGFWLAPAATRRRSVAPTRASRHPAAGGGHPALHQPASGGDSPPTGPATRNPRAMRSLTAPRQRL
jgi:hypothetical protein